MTYEEWGARASWRRRSKDFGALVPYDDGRPIVAMEYRPDPTPRWHRLRELWLGLPPHPHILDALEPTSNDGLLLRYAALDWIRPRIFDDGQHHLRAKIARRCAQIVDVFEFLFKHVGDEIGLFANPRIKVDLDNQIRVVFSPASPTYEPPREILGDKPRWDEQTLVYIVGAQLDQIARFETRSYMAELAEKCRETFARKRYPSLHDLREECERYGAEKEWDVSDSERIGWALIEEGFGWLELGKFDEALAALEAARAYAHQLEIVHWALDHVHERRTLAEHPTVIVEPEYVALSTLLAERRWLEALRPRDDVSPEEAALSAEDRVIRRARASLKAGDAIYALEMTERLLRRSPDSVDASSIAIEALLRLDRFSEALAYADGLVARAVDVGRYHYLRGKALFRLSRLVDARDAFERALALDGKLVEAMLLRREVDRAMKAALVEAGTQHAPVIELPDSLAPLRDVIVTGKPREIIEALSAPEYADNADAQLLLARYLALDGEPDRAQVVYDRVTLAPPPHRQQALVGKAGLMLAAGALVSALSLFDVACAEAPTDLDASEGRAQTLERLGRLGEAAAEYRRFVGLASSRADLRVRVAKQWLDDHVL
ncbi:MAG: tetratricopeptide repeat protein [Kofleriaceae bacterium]|nr:tetratricopeptide repeat protein [Kofleriaceae bacterium]